MWVLIAVGLLAGLITGVSPCVLPVLPVVFFAGGTARGALAGEGHLRRPAMIILGLVASFSVFTLLGSALLTAVGLPADFLRWAGLVVLVLVGLGLLFPALQRTLERPFQRLPQVFTRRVSVGSRGRFGGNAFVLGLGVGTLYVPCAGPVLAAISIAGTSGHLSGGIAVLTVAFSVGVAVPLFAFALAGAGISHRLSAYRRHSRAFRIAGGMVMVSLAVALTFNLTDALQRAVPSYTQALQNSVEDNQAARSALAGLDQAAQLPQPPSIGLSAPGPTGSAGPTNTAGTTSRAGTALGPTAHALVPAQEVALPATGPVVRCVSHAATLANCGPAPQIIGIQAWLNTPQNQPLTLTQLRGKVVLVNFWTFSCINCQRTLPYLKAWYAAYHSSGLEIIAVHTPEFSFEHELGNVRDAVTSDGITYPVALDNTSATWQNYHNGYWPAEYLIDRQGVIRHLVAGEGGYADSERLIRALLRAANPGATLPAPTNPAVPAG
jgi:cytochrome c biogenesis protein CcdA/thiol-disulfide isomerase/thioredoxin